MAKVSIIVPVYNVEPYLARCLDSILSQDYAEKEIIAVNDGSTDRSPEILRFYQARNPKLIIIDQKNQGLSEARNAGMRVASGEYILFVDSDDWLLPGSVTALVQAMSPDIDITELPVYDAFEHDMKPSDYQTPRDINDVDLTSQPSALFQIAVYAWAKLYRRELIEDLPFPKGLMHEDNYVAACLLPRLRRIKKVDRGGYCYYHRAASITSAYNTNMYDMIQIQEKIYQTYHDKGYWKDYHYLCEKMAVRNLCVAILGKKMAHIRPELRDTRRKAYDAIVELMNRCYPYWKRNRYVTWKEKLLVSFLLSGYGCAWIIWKGEELLYE